MKWDSIRECGDKIFDFKEVLEIRIKKMLEKEKTEVMNIFLDDLQ